MSRKSCRQSQGTRGVEWPRRFWLWLRRLLQRLRWAYWRSAYSWPLTVIGQFLRALLLLGLWLLVGSCIVRFLLPYLLPGVQLADKETIALLGTLLTALIGFGIQQWRGLEEEKQRESQKREEALTAIDELTSLIRDNPSEGARRYLEFKAKGGVWQSGQVRARLDEIWEKNAPRELKTAVALMEGSPLKKVEESEIRALLWAYTHLDDDWRCRAADVLHREGVSTPQQERLWLSLLRIHPTSSADVDWDRMRGLWQLGLERNPFGAEKAEADPLFLLEVRTYPSWWSKVTPIQSGLFVAEHGGGRTTMALLLAHDLLQSKEAFPVYWKPASVEMSPNHLVQAIAQALVNYIALRPSVYNIQRPFGQNCDRTAAERMLCGPAGRPSPGWITCRWRGTEGIAGAGILAGYSPFFPSAPAERLSSATERCPSERVPSYAGAAGYPAGTRGVRFVAHIDLDGPAGKNRRLSESLPPRFSEYRTLRRTDFMVRRRFERVTQPAFCAARARGDSGGMV